MKKFCIAIVAVLPLFVSGQCFAQEQQEPPTVTEMAATEAERLERLLNLEYWQVFYVDSTLQHDENRQHLYETVHRGTVEGVFEKRCGQAAEGKEQEKGAVGGRKVVFQ